MIFFYKNEKENQTFICDFSQNGKFAVAGTYDGRCIFYSVEQLKYHTMIHVRSSRGRNRAGRKVTGVEQIPGEEKVILLRQE